MFKKFIIFIILLSSANLCFAQNPDCDELYPQLIRKAKSYEVANKLKKAIQYYNMAAVACAKKSGNANQEVLRLFKIINEKIEAQRNLVNSLYFFMDKYGLAFKKNKKGENRWGYINKDGKEQFDGFIYSKASIFNEKDSMADVEIKINKKSPSGKSTILAARVKLKLNHKGYYYLTNRDYKIRSYKSVYLNLSNLNLSELPHSPVFKKIKNLSHIKLNGNKFSKIPAIILAARGIISLDMSDNNLASISPKIKQLNKLEVISLNGNGLNNFPIEFSTLSKLKKLNCSNNYFVDLPPNLPSENLREINFSNNKLKSISHNFSYFPNLWKLNLSNNHIESIDLDVSKLKKLKWIYLRDNNLKFVPQSLFLPSAISTIYMSKNKGLEGKGIKFREGFQVAKNILKLDLSDCGLAKLPACFNSSSIQDLYLRSNPNIEISSLSILSLKNLFLEKCDIKKFPVSITKCKNLVRLDLSENEIDSIPECISNLTKLTTFDLDNNNISNLPFSYFLLNKLTRVNLTSNNISELSNNIINMSNLISLRCDDNDISKIPESIFKLKKIRTIELRNNEIKFIPEILTQQRSISKIALKGNFIDSLPKSISNLKSLRTLDLSNNLISELPVEIGDLPRIYELLLSHNQLTTLPDEINQLVSLRILKIDSNQLESIPKKLTKLRKLKVLYLNKNNIVSIDLKSMSELSDLDLSDNEKLKSVNISTANKLRRINLTNNFNLVNMKLDNINELKVLDLRDTRITELAISNAPKLKKIYLPKIQLSKASKESLELLRRENNFNLEIIEPENTQLKQKLK